MNECTDTTSCDHRTNCTNLIGSYECSACPTPFYRNPNGQQYPCVVLVIDCVPNRTSELGQIALCTVGTAGSPSGNIKLALSSSTASTFTVASLQPTQLELTPQRWQTNATSPVSFQLTGQRVDDQIGSVMITVQLVVVATADPAYQGYATQTRILWQDIIFPTITHIVNPLIPLLGREVTIHGQGFDHGLVVWVNGQLVNNTVTVHSSGTELRFLAPAGTSDMAYGQYVTLRISNPDGGDTVCPPNCDSDGELYYVDLCPPDRPYGKQ